MALLWQAAGRLGIPASAAAAAEADGLLEIGTGVRFRHPLVRSAVYSAASLPERRTVHRALAEVTDRDRDPDRRAWHLAAAAPGPTSRSRRSWSGRRAGRRPAAGMAAAAAFLQRSVELTAEPARRSARALAAAQASLQAGAFEQRPSCSQLAAAGPLDELQQARVDLLRGQIAFASSAGGDAPALLMKAAKQFEPLDAGARAPDLPGRVGCRVVRRAVRGRRRSAGSLPGRPVSPAARRRAQPVRSAAGRAGRRWLTEGRAQPRPC